MHYTGSAGRTGETTYSGSAGDTGSSGSAGWSGTSGYTTGVSGVGVAYSDTYGAMFWDDTINRYITKEEHEEKLIKQSQLYILDEFTKDI